MKAGNRLVTLSFASDLWMRLGTMAENELSNAERAASFYEKSLATGRRTLRAYRSLLRCVPETDATRIGNASLLQVAILEPLIVMTTLARWSARFLA